MDGRNSRNRSSDLAGTARVASRPRVTLRSAGMGNVPRENAADRFDAIARAVVNGGASAAGAAMGLPPGTIEAPVSFALSFWAPPVQKRVDGWRQVVNETLEELHRRVGAIEDANRTDAVLDTLAAATAIAMRDASAKKREALRNAIVNAGLPAGPTATKRQLFLRLIDELTDFDIMLLPLLANCERWFTDARLPVPKHTGGTGMMYDASTSNARLELVVPAAFPEYRGQAEFVQLRLDELHRRGLIRERYQNTYKNVDLHSVFGAGRTFTSPLGDEFLRFIATPPPIE
jgi:hypothetical protein